MKRILHLLLLTTVILAAVRSPAEEAAAPRVFVCAHSFMIFTAKALPSLAQAAGIPHIAAGQQMLGGSRVIQHWNLPDERNVAKAALREGRVDVLTLSPHLLLPDEGIDNFAKLGIEKNPALRVLVQASWPPRDGVFSRRFNNSERAAATVANLRAIRDSFRDTWLVKLENQVRGLNQAFGREAVCIVPVGNAVFALRERVAEGIAPGLDSQSALFSDDLGHAQPPLAALVTYCHFAAIHRRSPVGLPVPEQLKTLPRAGELTRMLQQIAWDTVTEYPMSGVKAEQAPAAQ